jgi:hypothetical protein
MYIVQKIHPLWFVCLFTRTILIFMVYHIISDTKLHEYQKYVVLLLVIMGTGFIFKYLTGSNNEIQIAKVFWHDSRLLHGVLYLLAAMYVLQGNAKMSLITLSLDIIGSLMYRFS